MESERVVMGLLPAAKAGDEQAKERVMRYVFERWKGRVRRFYHEDPALDRDDILADYMTGIYKGIDKVDERGNPLYHLGQRGYWYVQSTVRAARRMRHGAEHDGATIVSLGEDALQIADAAADHREVIVERDEAARQVVRIVANARLSDTPTRLLRLMLAADPTEPGFNLWAAGQLGVSPQRVSQAMQEIEFEARHVEAGLRGGGA